MFYKSSLLVLSLLLIVQQAAMGDGPSWATAIDNLQDALAVADTSHEISVAQGVLLCS